MKTRPTTLVILGLLTLSLFACNKSRPESAGPARTDTRYDPCEELSKTDPHCGWKPHWDDTGVSVNAIDGTRTEYLAMDSSDSDGLEAGRLGYANLRVCFANGKLCGNKSVGVGVVVHGIVKPVSYDDSYSTSVRFKLDDEKPVTQTWGIADSHDALFPYGREEQFLLQLLDHKKLILEFSYYEQAPRTLTFELSGLEEKLKIIGIDVRAQARAKETQLAAQAAQSTSEAELRAKVTPQVRFCDISKDLGLAKYCWYPDDGSGPWGDFSSRELAISYGMDHYNDHSRVH